MVRRQASSDNGDIWLKPIDYPELTLPVDLFLNMQMDVFQGSGRRTRRQGTIKVRDAVLKFG